MEIYLFFLIFLGIVLFTIKLGISFYNIIYFLLDSFIITFFFIVGYMDSWGLKSFLAVNSWAPMYMFFRFLVIFAIFLIIKSLRKEKMTFYNLGVTAKIIVIVNVFVNVVTFFPIMFQWWTSSGR
jgi:hypothetical protein